jgi:DNA (cytosine-5)-methyltransferase 1
LYNAATQFFLTSNYSPTHLLSEDEDEGDIGEEENLSAQSSPREARSPELPRASNEDPGNSEDKSDLDGDSLESPNNNQTPVFSSLRGSLHSQKALQPSDLTIPKSRYIGYEPPLSVCKEKVAVQELQDAIKQQKLTNPAPETKAGGDYANSEEFELSHFAVYLPANNKWHPCEMRGLQHLATKQGHGSFYFNGILSAGGLKRYVQGVPFKICPIGGYGPENHEVGRDIWIKSDLNSKSKANIYYRLGAPASEYARFHEGFLWLANLAKHFVDFCEACEDPISIHNFRSDFHTWLEDTHGTSSRFRSWYQKYDNEDFSRAVVANVNFLFKESIGVNEELRSQPIWSETMEKDSIPYQQIQEKQTVVTPYVYECFKDIIFGHHLLPIEPSSISKMQHTMRGRALDLSTNSLPTTKPDQLPASQISIEIPDATAQFQKLRKEIQNIRVGSVLSVIKDGQGSVWKDEASRWKAATDNDCWYVYVQGIHESKNGQRSFHCIWLYSPADTMCALMKYPWPNELFLSDNCTCTGRRIKEDEILDVVSIQWHGNPAQAGLKLFIRQTYLENERFVTLKEAHKKCEHLKSREQIGKSIEATKHPIGQTLLVPPTQKSRHELESYEIIRYITEGSKEFAILRWLQRRRDIDGTGKANELVYTNKTDQVSTSKLHGTCLVRFYSASDVEKRRIPAPYSRDGTGNAFYITKRLVQVGGISKMIPIEEDLPITLIQGFDPASSPPRNMLRGIDLYCGGGNFGRGIGMPFHKLAIFLFGS